MEVQGWRKVGWLGMGIGGLGMCREDNKRRMLFMKLVFSTFIRIIIFFILKKKMCFLDKIFYHTNKQKIGKRFSP